jgi:predicted Rossmann fold nucleotide-binding protein DprA/Smf involved in DNA uptake
VVGSRNVDDALIEYSQEIGRLAASAGRTLVSGGARGIDQAAMRGALEAGGVVTGVLADSLEKKAMQREHRNLVLEGRLVLISSYDPNAGFNVGHAMQRNKLIYALADAALVVSADLEKGGTWAGASEQLDRLRLVPIFVRTTAASSAGLDALVKKGALPWPDPADADGLDAALAAPIPEGQSQLSFASPQASGGELRDANAPAPASDELFGTVRSLVLRIVGEPLTEGEVARRLGVTEAQAHRWLKRLVEEGALERSQKPVRYSVRQSRLLGPGSPGGPSAASRRAGSGK